MMSMKTIVCASAVLVMSRESLGAELVDTVEYPLQSWQLACGFLARCVRPNHLGLDGVDGDDGRVEPGTSVYAPAHGVVREARVHSGYGGTVIIEHDTGTEVFTSVIGHLRTATLAVRAGQDVRRGDRIGEIGSRRENGGFTPHVHWGIRRGPYASFSTGCRGGRVWEWSYAGYPDCSTSFDDWYNPAALVGMTFQGIDADGDGYSVAEGDCRDEGSTPEGVPASAIYPGATEVCNYTDDDCDGVTDEGFEGVLTPCDGADADLCAEGITTCDVGGASTSCTDTSLDTVEICSNGVDDDCDGVADEDGICSGDECETACPADMVLIEGVCPFCVDLYEASIVSGELGSATGEGTTAVAQAVAGVIPQDTITWHQANAACVNAGKRLCTAPEWQVACAGVSGWEYPYGPTYIEFACNDINYSWAYDFGILATGALSECVTPTEIYDLLGNVWEWTSTVAPLSGSKVIKGGAYNNSVEDLRCSVDHNVGLPGEEEIALPDEGWSNGGFRCCR